MWAVLCGFPTTWETLVFPHLPQHLFLPSFWCVTVCVFVFRVFVHVHICVHACGGRRSTSGVILQELPTLVFEMGSLTGTWGSPVHLGWLQGTPKTNLPLPSQTWGWKHSSLYPWLFTYVLETELNLMCKCTHTVLHFTWTSSL